MTAYVYMLKCSDGTFYTGWTTELERRVEEHNTSDKGAKYTRARRPCELVYYEEFNDPDPDEAKRQAMSREWFIKNKLTKVEKEKLIKSVDKTEL
ncbi:MAG: GIY-YIG nuclease family protein [Eubacterium sp.]|nr:GIY-YIG nuclease family protein [Eubacterium sp.]